MLLVFQMEGDEEIEGDEGEQQDSPDDSQVSHCGSGSVYKDQ